MNAVLVSLRTSGIVHQGLRPCHNLGAAASHWLGTKHPSCAHRKCGSDILTTTAARLPLPRPALPTIQGGAARPLAVNAATDPRNAR